MAHRCSFCGNWNHSSQSTCTECGETLVRGGGLMQTVVRVLMVVVGLGLALLPLPAVLDGLFDPRAAFPTATAIVFVSGVALILIGLFKK